MKLTGILLLSIALVACNGSGGLGEKDPLINKSENVQGALPPGTIIKPIPPLKDVVFIDAKEFYDFKVNTEKSVTFNYRVTHPDLNALNMEIPNLDSILPGATFDDVANKLTWTPPDDFVTSNKFIHRVVIQLVLYIDNKGKVEEHRQSVAINAIRDTLNIPEIVSVTGVPSTLKENQNALFQVTVRDKDSGTLFGPTITVVATDRDEWDGSSLVSNVFSPSQDTQDPELWHFTMEIDIRNKEITNYFQQKYFGLRAVSALGQPSVAWSGSFRSLTQLQAPRFFVRNQTFFKDQENSYTFSVADYKTEGTIEVHSGWETQCSNLTPAAECSCVSSFSLSTCTIKWKPAATGSHTITIDADNTIDLVFLNESVSGSASFTIDVQEGN